MASRAARSSAAAEGRKTMRFQSGERRRRWAPTSTLSAAVSAGKSRMFW